MEFEAVVARRQSVREYQDRQLEEALIEKLLYAAQRAPVGSNLYRDLHITVVQSQALLLKLCEAAWERFSSWEKLEEIAGEVEMEAREEKRPNLFYGAPTVFFVSHRRQTLQPGIQWANVTGVIHQMHLAATALGLGSCYMWGALESMRMIPALDHTALLELPEGFEPLCALAVGYPARPMAETGKPHSIRINRI